MRFAAEIGAAQTEIERPETAKEELISRIIIETKSVILSWQNFLNIESSHSKDSRLSVLPVANTEGLAS
jgi:hypothetical protein